MAYVWVYVCYVVLSYGCTTVELGTTWPSNSRLWSLEAPVDERGLCAKVCEEGLAMCPREDSCLVRLLGPARAFLDAGRPRLAILQCGLVRLMFLACPVTHE